VSEVVSRFVDVFANINVTPPLPIAAQAWGEGKEVAWGVKEGLSEPDCIDGYSCSDSDSCSSSGGGGPPHLDGCGCAWCVEEREEMVNFSNCCH